MRHRVRILLLAGLATAGGIGLAAGCPRADGYTVQPAFGQLTFDQMLGLYTIPGDPTHAALVTKDGIIRRADISDDRVGTTVFLDIKEKIIVPRGGEEGLLGLAFAPDYPASGRFYVYYSVGEPRRSRISRFVAHGDAADPASERVILEIEEPYANHNGGAMSFGPDGYLYIGVGDGGSADDPKGYGQSLETRHGKILRIDVSGDGYVSPPDNPFVGRDGLDEIYAYGFRNPWRVTFDRENGELWAGDAGQRLWEEADRVVKGGNYGWNTMEGRHCFNPPSGCDTNGKLYPRVEYNHDLGCAMIGGYVYRGAAMPELDGWYIYGDFCSGRIWGVDTTTENSDAVSLAQTGLSISSFAQDNAGEVYAITFNKQIVRLVRK